MQCSFAIFALLTLPLSVSATEVAVAPGGLAEAIASAQDGDILRLSPGRYDGPVIIETPLTLDGSGHATIDGGGMGSVVTVLAEDVTLRGLTVTGSGDDHDGIDSGIQLKKSAHRARVEDNLVTGNLYGIDIHGAHDALVQRNRIEGELDGPMNRRGNGIYVWNAPGTEVRENLVIGGRDGIFVNTSKKNRFIGNEFRDLRFAVHYMHADDSEVIGNRSVGNHLGFAVMFSTRVRVFGNSSFGDRDHGIMLNYANASEITGNLVRGGAEKCAFLYNSHKNTFTGNWFEGCDIGLHFTAGSARNDISENAFIGNRTQVKYISTGWDEWSTDGRGNYWSDFAAYDLDGDGLADVPYRPNDSMDHILWTQPAAKLLLGSPAVQLVRWSQAAFPALLPGGVIDSHPLMTPPDLPTGDTADG